MSRRSSMAAGGGSTEADLAPWRLGVSLSEEAPGKVRVCAKVPGYPVNAGFQFNAKTPRRQDVRTLFGARSSCPRVRRCRVRGSHPPRSGASGVGYDCFAGAPTRRVPAPGSVPVIVTVAAPGYRFSGVESEVIDLITSQLTARSNRHDPRTPGPTPRLRSCRSQYRGLSRLLSLSEGTGVLAREAPTHNTKSPII
jgi:hypothetical protein